MKMFFNAFYCLSIFLTADDQVGIIGKVLSQSETPISNIVTYKFKYYHNVHMKCCTT